MKFTLLHPSRGRVEQAYSTLDKWMLMSSGNHKIEHILSIDRDDPEKNKYLRKFEHKHPGLDKSTRMEGDNKSVVEATNRAAKWAKGEILIYLSDDFDCPYHWDELILEKLKANGNVHLWLLKVDDCLQRFHAEVLTIPIMSLGLYQELEYFWHPDYKSMWVDVDLYHTVYNVGYMIMAPELKFEHKHYSNGKASHDETYKRSDKNWDQGLETYNRRKAENFPL